MKKQSKRYNLLKNKIKKTKYPLDKAISLIKELGTAKFVESIDAHIALNIDPRHANQQFRASIVLPYGTGKRIRIAVFTEDNNISQILKPEVNLVGSQEIIENIKTQKFNFDILLTTPQFMPKLAQFGKILGPKGLMPSPKSGTVTLNLLDSISEFKKGKFECRADKNGIVHLSFGKVNFTLEELKKNFIVIYNSIEKNRPMGVKGKLINSIFISTTMSPSICLEINSINKIKTLEF